jgi:hypothetical protein
MTGDLSITPFNKETDLSCVCVSVSLWGALADSMKGVSINNYAVSGVFYTLTASLAELERRLIGERKQICIGAQEVEA